MWMTLALAASLSLTPQQAGTLALTNVRATYGSHGIARADTKLLPGDALFIAFDIEGISTDPSGKVLYSMTTEFTDAKGKVLFKQEPRNLEALNALGGRSLPGFVHVNVGLDQPPGDYTAKVIVTDRATKSSQVLTRGFQVLPRTFGIVRLTTTPDPEGRHVASLFQTGESLWVNFTIVGFERDTTNKQPNVLVEMRIVDEKGQPTLDRPFTGEIGKDIPASALSLPAQFLVSLNRPGKFTIELKASDHIGRKTALLSFPITVLATR